MADPAWLYTACAAVGGAVATGAGVLWRAVDKRSDRESAAKDQTIAILEADNARLRLERDALGKRFDACASQLEQERLRTLGVALRIRQDPEVDDALADDVPTAVRNMADLVSPPKSIPPIHPETTRQLRKFTSDGESTPPDPIPPAFRGKLPSRRG